MLTTQLTVFAEIGTLKLMVRHVARTGRVSWECRCRCLRRCLVSEDRLDGTHPEQTRSCRQCGLGTPVDPDELDSTDTDRGDRSPAANCNVRLTPAAIAPLDLVAVEDDGRYRVRCRCGTEWVASEKMLTGRRRVKKCWKC